MIPAPRRPRIAPPTRDAVDAVDAARQLLALSERLQRDGNRDAAFYTLRAAFAALAVDCSEDVGSLYREIYRLAERRERAAPAWRPELRPAPDGGDDEQRIPTEDNYHELAEDAAQSHEMIDVMLAEIAEEEIGSRSM